MDCHLHSSDDREQSRRVRVQSHGQDQIRRHRHENHRVHFRRLVGRRFHETSELIDSKGLLAQHTRNKPHKTGIAKERNSTQFSQSDVLGNAH